MIGKSVFQPMGWDAFGLPAETLLLNNVHPEEGQKANISHMKSQLKNIGILYDWKTKHQQLIQLILNGEINGFFYSY